MYLTMVLPFFRQLCFSITKNFTLELLLVKDATTLPTRSLFPPTLPHCIFDTVYVSQFLDGVVFGYSIA